MLNNFLWIFLVFTALLLVCLFHNCLFHIFSILGSFAILNSTFFKNLTARKIRTYVLGIATKFCLQYYANFNALINFHSSWNHQNQCGFQEASIETQILGDTQTHTWTFFHGVPYGMKLFLEELFSEVIFGTHHPKLLDNKFLQHLRLFCMLPLKTVRFYNSELAFIFTFEEESFAEKVANLKKTIDQQNWRRRFAKNILIYKKK